VTEEELVHALTGLPGVVAVTASREDYPGFDVAANLDHPGVPALITDACQRARDRYKPPRSAGGRT
jgi:hypothetical protein